MKILQLGTSLTSWGGIERYVKILTGGLRDAGDSVLVACPKGSPLEKHIGTGIIQARTRGKFDLRTYAILRREMKQFGPEIVHLHYSPEFFVGAMAAKSVGSKVILTRHVALRWAKPKAKIYSRLFDHIIPVSNAVQNQLEKSGIDPKKMTVAKAGNDPLEVTKTPEAMRKELGIDFCQFNIGVFGRLAKEKGVQVAIDGVDLVPGTTLHIFGAGPEEASLEKHALGKPVVFHGLLENVGNAMNAVDAVLIPSVWEEALAYAALEALSLGKPIIAARVGGLPELILDGENGRLFKPGDPESLAKVLLELMARPQDLVEMGRRGKALHDSTYTVKNMVQRISAVYESLLGI